MSILGQGYWECRRVGGAEGHRKKEKNLLLYTYCKF
jgi:hypothetical protein